jgi:hypothetical protein
LFASDNKTLQDISKWGGALSGIALAALNPTPLAIVGAVFGVLSLLGVFGGKPKTIELTDSLDVTGDGTNDKVSFRRKEWDYYYDVNANDAGLKIDNVTFKLDKLTVETQRGRGGGADGQLTDMVVNSGGSSRYQQDTGERYFLSLDVNYAPLFQGVTNGATFSRQLSYGSDDGGSYIDGIELTKEQYDQLLAAYGEQGSISGSDSAVNAFRPFLDGKVRFEQSAAGHGMNFYLDVNGDGNLDRVQQFMAQL